MGLVKFTIALLFVGLFSISIISYVSYYGNDNNSTILLTNDEDFNLLNRTLRSNYDSFQVNSNASAKTFIASEIKSGDENVEGGGQFKVGTSDLISNTKKIVKTSNLKIFGNDVNFGILTTALISILVLIAGLYAWAAWKGSVE